MEEWRDIWRLIFYLLLLHFGRTNTTPAIRSQFFLSRIVSFHHSVVCLSWFSESCRVMHTDCREKSRANWPSTQCELWVWSGQFPTETMFPLQRSGCTHSEYCQPTEEPFRHSEDLQYTLTLMALGWFQQWAVEVFAETTNLLQIKPVNPWE